MVTSHPLLVGRAIGRLQALPLRQVVVTDSIAWPTGVPLPLHMVSLAPSSPRLSSACTAVRRSATSSCACEPAV
jgi:hypothetical protein